MQPMAPRNQRVVVPPAKALQFFRLTESASLRELNKAYRNVVKKYHPDYNPHRVTWAHDAMVRINAAYDSALEYLADRRYREIEARLDKEIRKHDEFVALFASIVDGFLDGLFTYYQYGLENPHNRVSGTPRLRYKRAIRQLANGLHQLGLLTAPNPVDQETLDIFTTFAQAFQETLKITRGSGTPPGDMEKQALRHYLEGSRLLDRAIKTAFFRQELTNPRELAAPQSLAVSLGELMTVVAKYSSSSLITDTALKLCLLDAFQQLFTIEERIPGLGM